tara:strand:- start:973 stop:1797 length:825 start_codon:yes stop_codon:yes gene_type:complete
MNILIVILTLIAFSSSRATADRTEQGVASGYAQSTLPANNDTPLPGATDHLTFFDADSADLDRTLAGVTEQVVANRSGEGALPTNGNSSLLGDTSRTIFFDFDSVELDKSAMDVISSVVKETRKNPASEILISAHTDRSGPSAYNEKLSLLRADIVKRALRKQGLGDVVISTKGLGENRPFIITEDGVREPQNRRAEISLKIVFETVSGHKKSREGKDERHEDQLRENRLLQDAVPEKAQEQETTFQEGPARPQVARINRPMFEGWLKEVRLHD